MRYRLSGGVDLLACTRGVDRVKLGAYLVWDFASHVAGMPTVRSEMRLNLDGNDVVVQTFSSQLGSFVDIWRRRIYELAPGFSIQPGECVVDAGANVGFFALWAGRAVGPSGVVHAFEPSPAAFGLLARNVAANALPQVSIHLAALGQVSGDLPFVVDARGSSCGHLVEAGAAASFRVPVRTLDDLVERERLTQIDLLKLDTEGAEVDVLRGGAEKALSITSRIVMESHNTRAAATELLIPLGFEKVHDGYKPNLVFFRRRRCLSSG
jgi:FkbM family methyltransferase